MMPVTFVYDFDLKDYSLEFSGNNLLIKECVKDRTKMGKAKTCSSELSQAIQTIFLRHTGIPSEEAKKLQLFIKKLIDKVEQKIIQELPYNLGNLIALLQKILGLGVLGTLHKAQYTLIHMPIVESAAVKIKKENAEQEKCLRLQQEHKLLITQIGTPLGVQGIFGHTELKEKITAALEDLTLFSKILKQPLPENSLILIVEALTENKLHASLIKRFEQIKSTRFENKQMPLLDILRLAFFIEEKIFKVNKVAQNFFYKKKTGLARSLQFDPEKREVYLLADYNLSLGKDAGAFKQMAFCVRLEENNFRKSPEITIYLVTKSDGLILPEIRYDIANSKIEIAYSKRFIGARGLVQFRTATFYTDVKIQHASFIFTYCNGGNLNTLIFKSKKSISFQEKLLIAEELMNGLQFMHQKKIVHGDLKLENALCELDDKEHIVAARICDFGICYNIEEQTTETRKAPELYEWGHGCTTEFSPPEVYGTLNFTGDYYAVDVWGMGAMLYEIFFEKPLPWRKDLQIVTKQNFNESEKTHKDLNKLQKARATFREKVTSVIEIPFQSLSQQTALTKEEAFSQLIYKMMRLNPADRPTITKVLTELMQLKAR